MKNFFEFFGFLSTACISAALIFVFIGGKKDLFKGDSKGAFLTEMGAEANVSGAPHSISDRPMRTSITNSRKDMSHPSAASGLAPEERLKSLYNDNDFVNASAKQWKGIVRDAADEYNVKPQMLLAHVMVQSYLGDYTRTQLYTDAAMHAGERVKPISVAFKGYRYGWTMQKLMAQHDLAHFFPEEAPVAISAASISSSRNIVEKKMVSKGMAKFSAPMATLNPVEEGFKNMVAKEYGFASWVGMQKLADPDSKAIANKRVKTLMMASRVR